MCDDLCGNDKRQGTYIVIDDDGCGGLFDAASISDAALQWANKYHHGGCLINRLVVYAVNVDDCKMVELMSKNVWFTTHIQ